MEKLLKRDWITLQLLAGIVVIIALIVGLAASVNVLMLPANTALWHWEDIATMRIQMTSLVAAAVFTAQYIYFQYKSARS